jgi:hypothetical protein
LSDFESGREVAAGGWASMMKRILIATIFCWGFLAVVGGVRGVAQPADAAADASAAAEEGFVSIFDGKTLDGWDGDPTYWRVEDGRLVGEITPETVIKRNTFIIWRGGKPGDFDLKLDYRVSERGNSGVNYRSVELTDAKWSLAGYQADIDGQLRWAGQNYEERGRTFLAKRGEIAHVDATSKPTVIGSVGDGEALKEFISADWNELHIIARGNTLIHLLNGHATSIVVDDDVAKRTMEGLIGMQVHTGPPMTIEYRNIRLKQL